MADRLRESEACDYFEKAINEDARFAYAYLYLARLHPNVKTRLAFLARAEELADRVSEAVTKPGDFRKVSVSFETGSATVKVRFILEATLRCSYQDGHVTYDDAFLGAAGAPR